MFCTQCGKQNADTNKFCSGCGALLRKPSTSLAPRVNYGLIAGIGAVMVVSVVGLAVIFFSSTTSTTNSPQAVVEAFYRAVIAGEYSKARAFATLRLAEHIADNPNAYWSLIIEDYDYLHDNGNLIRATVTEVKRRGESAYVIVRCIFESGYSRGAMISLIVEDGVWKISEVISNF